MKQENKHFIHIRLEQQRTSQSQTYPNCLEDQHTTPRPQQQLNNHKKQQKQQQYTSMALQTCFQLSTILSSITPNTKHIHPFQQKIKPPSKNITVSNLPTLLSFSHGRNNKTRFRFTCQAKNAVNEGEELNCRLFLLMMMFITHVFVTLVCSCGGH